MYSKSSNPIYGFHGCDRRIRDAVINGEELKPSLNAYDWLGNGIYFWEGDPQRAYEWAVQASKRKTSSVNEPAVLGAVIDLGNCFNLMNRQSIPLLKAGYEWLKKYNNKNNFDMPQNENIGENQDLLYRYLDCAVIQKIHEVIRSGLIPDAAPFDSVKALFPEGKEVYDGAGFKEKTHIQLCIINPNCIKGYFLPRELDKEYPVP